MSSIRLQVLREQLAQEANVKLIQRGSMAHAARAWSAWRAANPLKPKTLSVKLDYGKENCPVLSERVSNRPFSPLDDIATWRSCAPPVPGVYVASNQQDNDYFRHWNGKCWSHAWSTATLLCDVINRKITKACGKYIEWLSLVVADRQEGLKVGDKVRVARRIDKEDGWANCWADDMDGHIGKTGVVMGTCDKMGVGLGEEFGGYAWPTSALEKVA